MEWYKLYKDFINSVPMGSIDEKDGEMHLINYNECNELYKYVKGDFGTFKIFSEPSISVCEKLAYCSGDENQFEFEERVNNMSYEKRLKMIDKHNKDRGDYKWHLAQRYGKYLKVFRAALMDKKIERKYYSSDDWEKISIDNLIECGPSAIDYRIVGEYRGK